MKEIIFAFATDDRKNFTKEHFGEAKEYLIYKISKTESNLEAIITNVSPEEKMHGDPNKAKGVASILKPLDVKVLVSKAFGKNIVHQQKKFVVILSQNMNIHETIKNTQTTFDQIVTKWKEGTERGYLKI